MSHMICSTFVTDRSNGTETNVKGRAEQGWWGFFVVVVFFFFNASNY